MIVIRKLYSSKNEKNNIDSEADKPIKMGERAVGGLAGYGGLKLIDDSYRKGEITGKVHMYHGTTKDAKKSILKEGIKGSKALDPNNLTNKKLGEIGKKDGRPLVYLGKKRYPSFIMALENYSHNKKPAMVNVSIPYNDIKKLKRVYDNPEFNKYNTKTEKEFIKFLEDQYKYSNKSKKSIEKYAKKYWDRFSGAEGTSGTAIFEGDIDTKYIKGSKDYQKNSIKEVAKYAKEHPKRFMKGLGKTALGGTLLAGGALLATGKFKKNKKEKNK